MIGTQLKFKLNFTSEIYLLTCGLILHFLLTKSQCIEDRTRRNYFTLNCSSDSNESKLQFIVDQDVKVIMNCSNIHKYSELEKLMPHDKNLGNFLTVQIHNCPLTHLTSLGKIIQQLGIRNYEDVQYFNYNMTSGMTRENLQDFSKRIQKLIIEIRPVMYVRDDLFADKSLRPLKHLYLYGDLTELHSNLFGNLNNLLTLHIEMKLVNFPHHAVLKRRTLSTNQLGELNKNVFNDGSSLPSSLLYLYVKNNNLQSLDPDSLKALVNVTEVNFNNNSLRSLPEGLFEHNKRLEKIALIERKSALKRLPSALMADLSQLLDVTIECNLEMVPFNLFTNSTNIDKIIMSHNKLEYLPAEIFQTQVHLRILDLSHNNLRNLSDKLFENLRELVKLKLAYNNLKDVDMGRQLFLPLRQMLLLDLNSNQLETCIWMPFHPDGNLQTLIMRNNSVSTMFSFQNNVSATLKRLDLSYNNISHIKSKNLELLFATNLHLDLSYNRIQTIDLAGYGTRTSRNGRQLQVNFNFNPLECDCQISEFIRYLTNGKGSLTFEVDKLKCQGPRFINGHPIKQLQMAALLCSVRDMCPVECNECWRRPYDGTFIVNCTNRALKSVPYLPDINKMSLTQMELNLENNQLLQLPLSSTTGYESVSILNVEANSLTTVKSSHLPPNLVDLNIKRNLLQSLNVEELLNCSKLLQNVAMSGNPFTCDCNDMSMWRFTHNHSRIFVDYTNMTCIKTPPDAINFFKFYESCPHKAHVPFITMAVMSSIAFLTFALYYKYQEEVQVWFYAHKWFRRLVAKYELNDDKCYDAFLAYSPQDESFVAEHLAPGLENSSPSFKLCIPSRDWLIGDCIPDQIVQAIDNSKRTIFVLSKSFVKSVWSKLEFKYAHQANLSEWRAKVIIIMYEDIGNINNLDLSLKAYLKTHSYLKWSNKRFWNKLYFVMPHKRPEINGHLMREVEL